MSVVLNEYVQKGSGAFLNYYTIVAVQAHGVRAFGHQREIFVQNQRYGRMTNALNVKPNTESHFLQVLLMSMVATLKLGKRTCKRPTSLTLGREHGRQAIWAWFSLGSLLPDTAMLAEFGISPTPSGTSSFNID